MLSFVKTSDHVHVRRADQSSIQTIGPGVIRASDRLVESAALFDQTRPPVAADIVESTHSALLIPQNDQTFTRHVLHEKVPSRGELALMAHTQPVIGKNTLLFLRENLR